MLPTRRLQFVFLLFLCSLSGMLAAQSYTSIVVFGDSLSDTGNDASVSNAKYGPSAQVPGPATGYTNGRFTDGTDTTPSAKNYYGVWVEQLAALLPNKPTINYSLNGGQNYAYGFATTNTGTSNFTYGPGNALNFTVNNMGAQVASYLATNPTITNKTLFIVWGGANDLIAATTAADIQAAAQREAGIVQTLINAGATDFIVPNLPPLGLVPRYNGSATGAATVTGAAMGFNTALGAYLGALPAMNSSKTLHLYQLDTYTLFNQIVSNPTARGFQNITASSSAALTGVTTVNPDTYLFWDDLHPTTAGHYQLATSALSLLGTPITTNITFGASNTQPNPGKSFTLTAAVLSGSGMPQGTVAFLDGGAPLASTYIQSGSGTTGTAAVTVSFPNAGTHTITATFTGVNGYASSTATASTTITVVAAGLNTSLSNTTLTGTAGSSFTDTLTLTPVGGYSGTATVACGTLPAHFSCAVSPASVTLSGNNTPTTATITLATNAMASLLRPRNPAMHSEEVVLACGILPGIGLLSFAGLRRRRTALGKTMLSGMLLLAGTAASLGMTGCSDNNAVPSNIAAKGTYTVPVVITSNGTTTTQNITVTLQ